MKTFIYALTEQDGTIRYVGKTIKPAARLADHLRDKSRNHRTNWIKSLLFSGQSPQMQIIEETSDDGVEAEKYWIAFMRNAMGCDLVNATDGGEGTPGRVCSAGTRRKIGLANSNPTDEKRLRLSAAQKGRIVTEEHRQKLSDSHRGHVPTAEQRRKNGDAHRGMKRSSDTCNKISQAKIERNPMRGRERTPEEKQRISESLKAFHEAKRSLLGAA